MDAADDAGSTDGTLDRIEASDALDLENNGHRGGETGDIGLSSSQLGRGVMSASLLTSCGCNESGPSFSVSSGDLGPDNGDFAFSLTSELLRSRPLPSSAVFLNDPFLFLCLMLCCAPAIAPPDADRVSSLSMPPYSAALSVPLLLRSNEIFDNMLPDSPRLCPVDVFSLLPRFRGSTFSAARWSLFSSAMLGNGTGLSAWASTPSMIVGQSTFARCVEIHSDIKGRTWQPSS